MRTTKYNMGLKDLIQSDATAVYLNTDDFAETITYTPKGGSATNITAIVTFNEDIGMGEAQDGLVYNQTASIVVSTNEVTDLHKDDTFTIISETWKVMGSSKDDGLGLRRIELIRISHKEKNINGRISR